MTDLPTIQRLLQERCPVRDEPNRFPGVEAHKDVEEESMAQDRSGFPQEGLFGDLKDPRLMYLKGWLFLLAGCVAGGGLLWLHPDLQTAFLLAVAVWSFCRLYYFMFYVIEHYVDGQYRFAGIYHFLRYLVRSRRPG